MYGTEEWFQHKRPDGVLVPLSLNHKKWMPDDALIRNVEINMRRPVPRLYDRPDQTEIIHEPLAIVAGGPSLNRTMERLRTFKNVMVIASAHDHVSRAGINLSYAVISDGIPTMADCLRYPQKNCTYLLASQLDPACFEAVEGCPVEMWHYAQQVPHEMFKGETTVLLSASTVCIGAQIALRLGYQHFHFFGFDCSYDDETHAYEMSDKMELEQIVAEIGPDNIPIKTNMGLCAQARAFFQMVMSEDGNYFHSTIHGSGLVALQAKLGNDELRRRIAVVGLMALDNYITQVQRLLHDPSATYYSTIDLTAFINQARGQVSIEGQCIRLLVPSTNSVSSATITNGGSGYSSAPAVAISGNGTGATATSQIIGGAVTNIIITAGGSGYDKTTTISFSGGGGTGAAATANVICNNTVVAQEVYTFASLATVVQLTTGVQGIMGLRSIAVSWGSLKPMLEQWVWSDFQAYLRSNNSGLQSWPAVWSQYGQGAAGSIYVYPLPSTIAQWDWDVYCYPLDLADDTTPEALTYPWTDAVAYYAAFLAYDNSQRNADADRMFATYERFMKRARALSQTDFVPDPYDNRRW